MNKAELIERIAKDTGVPKSQAKEAIDSITRSVMMCLKKGERVMISGFGTFSVRTRAARNRRNPQTGAAIKAKARKFPKFKAGKEFADSIGGRR
jgi:DNA-binding protein HU-beta